MKSLTNSFLLTLRRALQSKFGYIVHVTTEDWNVFTHYSWTLADALSWASCYPVSDIVEVRQANLRQAKLVLSREEV